MEDIMKQKHITLLIVVIGSIISGIINENSLQSFFMHSCYFFMIVYLFIFVKFMFKLLCISNNEKITIIIE